MPWPTALPLAGADAWSVASAMQLSVLIASAGFAVSTLEDLTAYAQFRDDGLLSWRVAQLRGRWSAGGPLAAAGDRLFGADGYRRLLLTGFAAAALLLVTLASPALLLPLAAVILTILLLGGVRNVYGADGADQMNLVLFATVVLYLVVPDGSFARTACLWFLAWQVGFGYFVAGAAKLASPVWRSGEAVIGVLSTHCYGHDRMYQWLRRHPRVAQAGCWAVMLFEVAFPLVFVLPPPFAAGLLVAGVAFHAGCAVFMGLNNFLFAFVATYPLLWALVRRAG